MDDVEQTLPAHRITWFAPQRPVENGTVYVRPEPVDEQADGEDLDCE